MLARCQAGHEINYTVRWLTGHPDPNVREMCISQLLRVAEVREGSILRAHTGHTPLGGAISVISVLCHRHECIL